MEQTVLTHVVLLVPMHVEQVVLMIAVLLVVVLVTQHVKAMDVV